MPCNQASRQPFRQVHLIHHREHATSPAAPPSRVASTCGTTVPSEDDVKDAIRVAREVNEAAGKILENGILSPGSQRDQAQGHIELSQPQ